MLRFAVPDMFAESVTSAVKEKVPAIVGVPEITPLEEFKVRPGGKLLPEAMLHV